MCGTVLRRAILRIAAAQLLVVALLGHTRAAVRTTALLVAQHERVFSRFELAAEGFFLAVANDFEFNVVARIHLANLRNELVDRLYVAAVHLRDAVVLLDSHLFGRAVAMDADYYYASPIAGADADTKAGFPAAASAAEFLLTAVFVAVRKTPTAAVVALPVAVVAPARARGAALLVPLTRLVVPLACLFAALSRLLVAGAMLLIAGPMLLVTGTLLLIPLALLSGARILLLFGRFALLIAATFVLLVVAAGAALLFGLTGCLVLVLSLLLGLFVLVARVLRILGDGGIRGDRDCQASEEACASISVCDFLHPSVSFHVWRDGRRVDYLSNYAGRLNQAWACRTYPGPSCN